MKEFEWADASTPPSPRRGRAREWLGFGVSMVFGAIGIFVVFACVLMAPLFAWGQNINCTNYYDCTTESPCAAKCETPILIGMVAHPVVQLFLVFGMMSTIAGSKRPLSQIPVGVGWLATATAAFLLYNWWFSWPR